MRPHLPLLQPLPPARHLPQPLPLPPPLPATCGRGSPPLPLPLPAPHRQAAVHVIPPSGGQPGMLMCLVEL